MGEDTASSFFDIGVRWSDLDEKDARLCRYVKIHIHKLSLGVPYGTMAHPIEALEELVIKFYEGIKFYESRRWRIREESSSAIC